jgi:hypothetical protein
MASPGDIAFRGGYMKKLLIAAVILIASKAQAQGKQEKLVCTNGPEYQTFRATLDHGSYTPSSGFFNVKNANIVDNYATARLLCRGHRLDEITCVGFWFESSQDIVEVTVSRRNKNLEVRYKALKGEIMGSGGGWPCSVEEI